MLALTRSSPYLTCHLLRQYPHARGLRLCCCRGQEAQMLARDTLRCTLVRRRASALGGNGELAAQQPLEDGDAPPDGDADAPRLVCAMVGRGVLLDGKVRKVAVPCALEPTPQLHLRACMLDALKQS